MQYNEGIFFGMNAVFYYSNTDQSKTVSEYIANALGWDIFNIEDDDGKGLEYEKAFVVFPVHCQNIPARVKSFLSNLLARYLIPVATYGRMHHGNVLYEIENGYDDFLDSYEPPETSGGGSSEGGEGESPPSPMEIYWGQVFSGFQLSLNSVDSAAGTISSSASGITGAINNWINLGLEASINVSKAQNIYGFKKIDINGTD